MTPAESLAAAKGNKKKLTVSLKRSVVWACGVRERRKALGLSVRDLETATGVSNPTICSIERGCDVRLKTAMTLADFFGVTVEKLWQPIDDAAGEKADA